MGNINKCGTDVERDGCFSVERKTTLIVKKSANEQ